VKITTSPCAGISQAGGALRNFSANHATNGYIAVYRHAPQIEAVFVLALRSQREAGYKRVSFIVQ
jgi:toxin ParE1/3/4